MGRQGGDAGTYWTTTYTARSCYMHCLLEPIFWCEHLLGTTAELFGGANGRRQRRFRSRHVAAQTVTQPTSLGGDFVESQACAVACFVWTTILCAALREPPQMPSCSVAFVMALLRRCTLPQKQTLYLLLRWR